MRLRAVQLAQAGEESPGTESYKCGESEQISLGTRLDVQPQPTPIKFVNPLKGFWAAAIACVAVFALGPVAHAGKWRAGAPLPRARSGITATVLNDMLVVVGGESPSRTFNDVDAYDAEADSWGTLLRLPTARHGLGATSVAGRIFVISSGPDARRIVLRRQPIFRTLMIAKPHKFRVVE